MIGVQARPVPINSVGLTRVIRTGGAGVSMVLHCETSELSPTTVIPNHPLRREACHVLGDSDDRRGAIIDSRYLLLERVGSGGTGSVYQARDLLLGATVAVKLLHAALGNDEDVTGRFRREAHLGQRFHHANIVRTFRHGVADGTHYIVMEHVQGTSLRSLIAKRAPVDAGRAIELTLQLLEATGCIHDQGVIHRDLKPENVRLAPAGIAKVTDFGIACHRADDVTPNGSVLGTIHYVAPELVRGTKPSKASDLYAIGIILYELLTGRLPFEGELARTVLDGHLNDQPLAPDQITDFVTSQLSAIVMRALAKSPIARFADSRSFASALRGEAGSTRLTTTLRTAA
jgi:serine/threonine protein kinase